jgi:hypothetical protein
MSDKPIETDPYHDRPIPNFPQEAFPQIKDKLEELFGEGPYHFSQFAEAVQRLSGQK